uniref:SAGA associated factor 29 n=1 Tax=Echinococcus granulosus TaxID=6210 RepID=A0A068WBP0_ECHGR|nr:SAGA associated factor 29 [Echinococcus granulosus]
MELELMEKVNELSEICKEVAEGRCSSQVSSLEWGQVKVHKGKHSVEQKRLWNKKLQEVFHDLGSLQKALLRAQDKIFDLRALEHKIKIAKGPRNMRRGVLMSLLQESAKSIPMWAGGVDEPPPPLCGAIGAGNNLDTNLVAPGDYVAALVPDLECPDAEFAPNESWILAEVISFNREKRQFQVEDVDAEEGKVPKRYTLDRSKVILLPKWKANPVLNPDAVYHKGTLVLALYPQTTCFYRAVVDTYPTHAQDEYSLYFEDPSYPDGYAPSIRIPQRYVILCPETDHKSTRQGRNRLSGRKS